MDTSKKDTQPPKDNEFIIVTQRANGRFEFDKHGEYFLANADKVSLGFVERDHRDRLVEELILEYIPEVLYRGVLNIPPGFEDIKQEIEAWLENRYKIKPQQKGFVAWFSRKKLWPFVKENTCIMWPARYVASENLLHMFEGKAAIISTHYPKITHKDLVEYCLYRQQELERIDLSLRTLMAPPKQKAKDKPALTKTYLWLGTDEQLDALFALLSGTYVNCSLSMFKGVFGAGEFIGPVVWIKDNVSELLAFLCELQEMGFLERPKRQSWELLKRMFKNSEGEEFAEALKNLYDGIEANPKQKSRETIREIMLHIL